MAKVKEFPKVKGLYKKRTANGTRYVLHGSKKDGGHRALAIAAIRGRY